MTFLFFGQATTSAAHPAPAAGACNPVGFPPSAPGYREMYLVAWWEMTWESWNDWWFYGDNYGDSMAKIPSQNLEKKILRTHFSDRDMIHDSVVSMSVRTWKIGIVMVMPWQPLWGPFWGGFSRSSGTRSPEKGLSELEKHPKYVGKSNKTFGIPSSQRKLT